MCLEGKDLISTEPFLDPGASSSPSLSSRGQRAPGAETVAQLLTGAPRERADTGPWLLGARVLLGVGCGLGRSQDDTQG